MQGLGLTLALLGAVTLGALGTALSFHLAARFAVRPARAVDRRLDRMLQVEQADRARLLNLLLAAMAGEKASLQMLTATSPAQPPAPDPDLGMPEGYADLLSAGAQYAADPNDMDGDDDLDHAALGIARR